MGLAAVVTEVPGVARLGVFGRLGGGDRWHCRAGSSRADTVVTLGWDSRMSGAVDRCQDHPGQYRDTRQRGACGDPVPGSLSCLDHENEIGNVAAVSFRAAGRLR